MKNFLKNNIYLIPPAMLIATFVSKIVGSHDIVAANTVGYSLLSSVGLIYLFWFTNAKYCWFTKLSALALPLMNLACILFVIIEYKKAIYYFDLAIVFITVFLALILAVNKKLK